MERRDELLSSFDKYWKEFSRSWRKARANASEKSIHNLRVSTRRLISTLALTRVLSRNAGIPQLQRRFRKVLKRMGPLRDTQVQLVNVSHMRQAGLIPDFKRRLKRREEREIDDIRQDLKRGMRRRLSKRVKGVRAEFERLLERLDQTRVRRSVGRFLRARRNEFLKAQKRFNPNDGETLHAMRIALKKLRYALEAAQPILGQAGKVRAKQMQALQQLMGETRDVEMLRSVLEKWAAKRGQKTAIVPALGRLEQKRETLLRKIIQSAATLENILPEETLRPAAENTQAISSSNIPLRLESEVQS
jgi:CHAD domain-containing protein